MIAAGTYPHPLGQDVATLRSDLLSIRDRFIWAPGQIVWDDPGAIKDGMQAGNVVTTIRNKLEALQSELLMEAAYFIIREYGVETVRKMRDRGVRIRVLTNSMASNDVLAAHADYSQTRKDLIASGMEIYELRPDAAGAFRQRHYAADAKTGLHAKAMVFDREAVRYDDDPETTFGQRFMSGFISILPVDDHL